MEKSYIGENTTIEINGKNDQDHFHKTCKL